MKISFSYLRNVRHSDHSQKTKCTANKSGKIHTGLKLRESVKDVVLQLRRLLKFFKNAFSQKYLSKTLLHECTANKSGFSGNTPKLFSVVHQSDLQLRRCLKKIKTKQCSKQTTFNILEFFILCSPKKRRVTYGKNHKFTASPQIQKNARTHIKVGCLFFPFFFVAEATIKLSICGEKIVQTH